MTVKMLIEQLKKEPQDYEVEMEFRYKTGYDEGDIYTAPPQEMNSFSKLQKKIVLTGPWHHSGGW
jgi:hypothetical protein